MSTDWNMDCTGGSGTAASFVVQVNVYVDGSLAATVHHTPVDGEPPRWSFSVPLDLDGTHTVRVTDIAANGPTEYEVFESSLVCSAVETTTTTTLPVVTTPTTAPPTTPVPTVTAASLPVLPSTTTTSVPTSASVETASTIVTPTTVVPTTATALGVSITAAPATLPATGAATGPLLDVGLGLLIAGVAALFTARRPHRLR